MASSRRLAWERRRGERCQTESGGEGKLERRKDPGLAESEPQKTRERAKIRVGPEEVRREVEPSLKRLGDIMPDPLPW